MPIAKFYKYIHRAKAKAPGEFRGENIKMGPPVISTGTTLERELEIHLWLSRSHSTVYPSSWGWGGEEK